MPIATVGTGIALVGVALVRAGLVAVALVASVRISPSRVSARWVSADLVAPGALAAAGALVTASQVAAGALIVVLRVGLARGPGRFAGAAMPGVAPGAVLPPRVVRLGRRAPAAVPVVLAIRRGVHGLGYRGRVAVGGPGVRRRGPAARCGLGSPERGHAAVIPAVGRLGLRGAEFLRLLRDGRVVLVPGHVPRPV